MSATEQPGALKRIASILNRKPNQQAAMDQKKSSLVFAIDSLVECDSKAGNRHNDNEEMQALIKDIRSNIKTVDIMAFGVKHYRVFTGKDFVSLLQQLIPKHFKAMVEQQISRPLAMKVAEFLLNKHFVIVPSSLQLGMKHTRRTEQQLCDQVNAESLAEICHSRDDASTLVDCGKCSSREHLEFFDNETTLYRLWKDALLQKDYTQQQLDHWIEWEMKQQIKFKSDNLILQVQGGATVCKRKNKNIFRTKKFSHEDQTFSERSFVDWMKSECGVSDMQEVVAVREILLEKRYIKKVSMLKCYKFIN